MQVELKTDIGQDKAGTVVVVSEKHGALLIQQGSAKEVAVAVEKNEPKKPKEK